LKKETGIIMSGNHPQLIIDLLKTMTRRTYGLEMVNQFPDDWRFIRMEGDLAVFLLLKKHFGKIVPARSSSKIIRGEKPNLEFLFKCPYGQVGGRLIIKETWATEYQYDHLKSSEIPQTARIYYLCDDLRGFAFVGRKRSARFMCHWMSRARPEITGLRAERLQEIKVNDAIQEGIVQSLQEPQRPRELFRSFWDFLNAKCGYSWEMNSYVWVIGFKVIK